MNIDLVSHPLFPDPNAGGAWVLGLLGKSVLIVAAGFLAEVGFRKSSAATRHGAWVTAFALLVALLAASLAIPFQRVELTPAIESATPVSASESAPFQAGATDPMVVPGVTLGEARSAASANPSEGGELILPGPGIESETSAPVVTDSEPLRWGPWVFSTWIGGLMIWCLWTLFLYGIALMRHFRGTSQDENWNACLREGQERLGIRRRCQIRFDDSCRVPMTLGLLFPKIVLPDSARQWDAERRRAVLWHELAHVRRLDFITQFLARMVTAIFWPNVLCWLALRRMHETREQACDDAVLRELGDPEGYAKELVETVRGIKHAAFSGAGVAIASPGSLKERVAGILDTARNRGRMSCWVYASGVGSAVLAVFLGLVWVTSQAEETNSLLQKSDRDRVGKILEAINRNVEQYSHGTFAGEQNTFHWDDGTWDNPPMPERFRAWVGGKPDRPMYRVDFTPSVSPWSDGAAPYYIEDATHYSDGVVAREVSHDHFEDRLQRSSPLEELVWLPGMNALLHVTGGRSTVTSTGRRGAPPRNLLEYYLMIASGRERHRIPDGVLQFQFVDEKLDNVAVVRFEVVIDGYERERWWMDPAREYALLKRDHAFQSKETKEWKTAFRIRVPKLIKAGEGFWFPGEVHVENIRISSGEPTFKRVSRIREASFGEAINDDFFSQETVLAAVREKRFGEIAGRPVKPENTSSDSMELILIDGTTEKPMPGVEIKVKRNRESFSVTSNSEGRCAVSLDDDPAGITYLSLSARPDGFVPAKLSWRRYGDPLSLPAEYRIILEPGQTIGGRVVDGGGNPISEATVSLRFPVPQPIGSQSDSRLMRSAEVKTDQKGNWRYHRAPKEVSGMLIGVEHPGFAADPYLGSFRHKTLQPYETLFDFSAKLVLEGGRRISGKVIDPSGQPVADATVKIGRDRWGANYPVVRTNAEGNFAFQNVKPESEVYVTVEAGEHGPALFHQREPDLKKAVVADFRLEPANILSVQIVDESGNPVESVLAVADTWRETRSLDFSVRTDKDGRFQWKNAPKDTVLFDFLGREITLRDVPLKAGEAEQTVVLRPAIRIRGTAVDAESGTEIPEFRVVLGRKTEETDREIYWREDTARTFSGGKFERTASNLGWLYFFRAEADGYQAEVIGPFRGEAKDVEGNFRLKPAG